MRHQLHKHTQLQNHFSDISAESFFSCLQTKHSGLRYHTSTLHCWTWPPSPRRRISNFPDPASPLVQCWHAAGSQLLLEAACESQQRQTHPTRPASHHQPTPPLVFLMRVVVAFWKRRGQNCCLISRSKPETWQLIGTVVAAADSVLSLWTRQKKRQCWSVRTWPIHSSPAPRNESAAAPAEGNR